MGEKQLFARLTSPPPSLVMATGLGPVREEEFL